MLQKAEKPVLLADSFSWQLARCSRKRSAEKTTGFANKESEFLNLSNYILNLMLSSVRSYQNHPPNVIYMKGEENNESNR